MLNGAQLSPGRMKMKPILPNLNNCNNTDQNVINYKDLVKNKLVNRKTKTGDIYGHPKICPCVWCNGKSRWVNGIIPEEEKEVKAPCSSPDLGK